jgi:hypothetical protein
MSLPLPPTFAFSQSSLQAYADCPRRFWLAYVQQLPWPAIEAAPLQDFEKRTILGARFHQNVERKENGISPDILRQGLNPPLSDWFDAYLRHRPALPTQHVEVERTLSIPFGNQYGAYRLAAKYDLIAAGSSPQDQRTVIVDWKTTLRPGQRANLERKLQTIVYPFVLVEASGALPWGPVEPEQVEMLYWFTAAPSEPVIFHYSSDQHAANRTYLYQLLTNMLIGAEEADFPKVPDTEQNRRRLCNYCVYRSRCDRGVSAGLLDEQDELGAEFFAVDLSSALEFTLEDVEELAF